MVADKDTELFRVFAAIETTNFVLSLIFNIVLILVIIKCSKELSSYRYLLIAFAFNDIWFPIVHAFCLPIICSYGDAFIMFSNGILTSKFSICLYASTFSMTMPVMAHLFLYRLVVLRWQNLAKFYTGRNTSIIILSTALFQLLLWFANCWFNYDSDEELQSYVKPFLDEQFPGAGQGHIGALYFNENGIRMSAVLTTMGFNAIMFFWSAIITICSVLIVKSLRTSVETRGKRTHHLQKQMFKTLLVQMAVPMLCVYLPCAGIINFPMFFRISVFPNFVSAAVTVFPIVDAIITLVGVRIFRKTILAFCRKIILCNSDISPVTAMTISSSTRH